MPTSQQTIVVCGAGTMGCGIAQVAAQHGFTTILYDIDPLRVEAGAAAIQNGFKKLVSKNKITSEQEKKSISLLRYVSDICLCRGNAIIEAVVEKLEVKRNLFRQLAEINDPDSLFASNTSSLSLTEIANDISNPQRVCGMHFFNPAPLMKLVEIVAARQSSQQTISGMMELARQMGKTAILCKDSAGFVVNRVARPFYLEALRLAEKGVAGFEEIDQVIEAAGFRMGPFRLMDLIGNDINLAVSRSLYDAFNQTPRFKPSGLQESKVENGELGRKSGKGYYSYS